jgi:hypothetical protein
MSGTGRLAALNGRGLGAAGGRRRQSLLGGKRCDRPWPTLRPRRRPQRQGAVRTTHTVETAFASALEPTGSAKSASDKSSTNSASCAHSHTHEPALSFTLPCNAHTRTRTRTHAGPRARTPGACRSAADTRVHTPAHRCRDEDAAATPTHALAGLPETASASTRITSAPAHEKGPQIRVARDARTHARLVCAWGQASDRIGFKVC